MSRWTSLVKKNCIRILVFFTDVKRNESCGRQKIFHLKYVFFTRAKTNKSREWQKKITFVFFTYVEMKESCEWQKYCIQILHWCQIEWVPPKKMHLYFGTLHWCRDEWVLRVTKTSFGHAQESFILVSVKHKDAFVSCGFECIEEKVIAQRLLYWSYQFEQLFPVTGSFSPWMTWSSCFWLCTKRR